VHVHGVNPRRGDTCVHTDELAGTQSPKGWLTLELDNGVCTDKPADTRPPRLDNRVRMDKLADTRPLQRGGMTPACTQTSWQALNPQRRD